MIILQYYVFGYVFHDGGPYYIEARSVHCSAQQVNGLVLYDRGLRHERVKVITVNLYQTISVKGLQGLWKGNNDLKSVDDPTNF